MAQYRIILITNLRNLHTLKVNSKKPSNINQLGTYNWKAKSCKTLEFSKKFWVKKILKLMSKSFCESWRKMFLTWEQGWETTLLTSSQLCKKFLRCKIWQVLLKSSKESINKTASKAKHQSQLVAEEILEKLSILRLLTRHLFTQLTSTSSGSSSTRLCKEELYHINNLLQQQIYHQPTDVIKINTWKTRKDLEPIITISLEEGKVFSMIIEEKINRIKWRQKTKKVVLLCRPLTWISRNRIIIILSSTVRKIWLSPSYQTF